jgi:hypothetical protein
VIRSVRRTGWDYLMPIPPNPLKIMLLDARVHDTRYLRHRKGGYLLLFALSCYNQEAEVLVLVHDYAGRIS